MHWSLRLFCRFAVATIALGAEPRAQMRLDSDGRFHRGEIEGAFVSEFDDTAWETVTIPHTWNNEANPPAAHYYRGLGWYRKQFMTPSKWKGRRVFMRFEAAILVARVFLNGKELGEHKGGFAAFCYELTPYLKSGANNVLAVREDNSRREDATPLSGDFTIYGGLYRPVTLIATAPVNISLTDHASPGVFLQQSEVTPDRARIAAVTKVSNGTGAPRKIAIAVTVFDERGSKVVSQRQAGEVASGDTRPITAYLQIDKPHLWNGVSDPYLYTARVELRDGGKVADTIDEPLGLCFFRFDPALGFLLNGRAQQIRGVCRHRDWDGLG